jgi:hypothetical protein
MEDTLASTNPQVLDGDEGNQTENYGRGLILWGEPHIKESWEATPYFFRKWSWVIEGCSELVKISNRWRKGRGQHPLETSLRVE